MSLLARKCSDCNYMSTPPMPICPSCGSEAVEDAEFSGKGTIYTYTIVHMGFGNMQEKAPYALVVAELEEGSKLTTVLTEETDLESLAVGDRIEYSHTEEGIGPFFKKVA